MFSCLCGKKDSYDFPSFTKSSGSVNRTPKPPASGIRPDKLPVFNPVIEAKDESKQQNDQGKIPGIISQQPTAQSINGGMKNEVASQKSTETVVTVNEAQTQISLEENVPNDDTIKETKTNRASKPRKRSPPKIPVDKELSKVEKPKHLSVDNVEPREIESEKPYGETINSEDSKEIVNEQLSTQKINQISEDNKSVQTDVSKAETSQTLLASKDIRENQRTNKKSVKEDVEEKLSKDTPKKKSIKEKSIREDGDNQNNERRPGLIPLPIKYDENSTEPIPKHPKDPIDAKLIKAALEKNEFLNRILKGQLLNDVVEAMYNKEINSKEVIIREGEKGSHLFISAKGKYEISVKGKGVVNTFDDVRVFGELAILYNDKRMATIKAVKSGRVWVLDRSVYQQLMVRSNIKEQDEMLNFLQNVEKLNTVGVNVLRKVANLLKVEFFPSGATIVRQGDRGDKFYIIRAGTVTISIEGKGVVDKYKRGRYFGELALLKEDARQATVTADAPGVECLTLQRQHFIDHFGEVDDISTITVKSPLPKAASREPVIEFGNIELSELRIVKTLGVGGFGRVELVQHLQKPTLIFALKYLKKIDMVEQNQQEHVYNEKNIQISCRSMFIIRLYRTFKDRKYIYFLMESCLGGDLWTLLQKQKNRRFEEKDARFIAACVLEAFGYLHERGIVYRDLKPENLLIDKNGYIKLTDFGFAKKLGPRGKTFTFAGTPEYVAPEIVLNRGHDKAVDYWAFGIFIFELLTGRTPFRTNDSSHMRTYNRILSGVDNVEFPPFVSHKARHIIEKLCRPLPTERLGCLRSGIKDVKSSRWFMGFDWAKLNDRKLPAPFKPKLKSDTDTQYFESFKRDDDNPPDEISGWDEEF